MTKYPLEVTHVREYRVEVYTQNIEVEKWGPENLAVSQPSLPCRRRKVTPYLANYTETDASDMGRT